MYKLILVDDEEEVRKGILEKIHWEDFGFEIIGEAANGVEALEIAEKNMPDVVITDIKMPFMDGIALSQSIKEKYKSVKVVILTGFDEFEYAQKAIKLNVDEYVLKPISSKEFIDVLLKIKIKLDNELAQKRDFEVLKDYYEKSIPLLREKFLNSLVASSLSKEEIVEKTKAYGLNLNGTGFAASTIDLHLKYSLKEDSLSNPEDDMELIRFAAFNIAQEILENYSGMLLFRNNDYIVMVFISDNLGREQFIRRNLIILEEIKQSIEKYIKCDFTVGVGVFVENVANISLSYKSSISALDYRIMLGSNKIICIDDIEPKYTNKVVFDELKQAKLISSLKVGTIEEVEKAVEDLFDYIITSRASFKDYNIYLVEMLTAILKAARDLEVDMDKIFGINFNPFMEIYRLNDLGKVKAWVIDVSEKIKRSIIRERQNSYKYIVERALEYINKNYSDSELTVDKLCKILHISPNYFSAIFKKETKQTFVNYITNLRLEKAKELLRSTSLKTFEIARKVGYSEPNYFSYCFKKNLNMSPSEYRSKV